MSAVIPHAKNKNIIIITLIRRGENSKFRKLAAIPAASVSFKSSRCNNSLRAVNLILLAYARSIIGNPVAIMAAPTLPVIHNIEISVNDIIMISKM